MREMGLKCTKYSKRRRKYDSSKGLSGKKAKNVIRRRFMSNRKYQKMVCDITELKAKDGSKVYLEIIKDLATKFWLGKSGRIQPWNSALSRCAS